MISMDKDRCCKKLNLPSEMMPDIDISQFDTDGCRWQDFYRLLRPCDFNNDKLFDFLKSYGIYSPPFLEVFYTPPFDDGRIHTDSSHEWVKLYFQFGAKGSTLRWWKSDNVMNTIDTTEDVAVLQSEVNDMKQAVVSMSVGQPQAATKIVKDWILEEAPPEPEIAPATPESEDDGGNKKKKKK